MIETRIIDAGYKADIRIPNDPFRSFGLVVLSFDGENWAHRITRFDPGDEKDIRFPDEDYDFDSMKDCVFIGAYDESDCIGLALLQHIPGKYMHIVDLKVNGSCRRRKIGRMLIEKAREAAAQYGYQGIYLECQDDNPGAFLFYINSGFYIGGLNTNTYRHTKLEGRSDILLYSECKSDVGRIAYNGEKEEIAN